MNPTEKKHTSKTVYADDLVMRGRRTSARFNGQRLEITRGRTTWQIPARAIQSIERHRGTVHMTLSGEPAPDQRTPPLRFRTASTPNATRFTEWIEQSLLAEDTVPDGYTLITANTRPSRLRSRAARSTAIIASSFVLYVGTGLLANPTLGTAVFLSFVWPFGIVGALACRMFLLQGIVYSLILWRRGITVTGEVRGVKNEYITFTTLEGEHFNDVESAGLATNAYGEAEITYDPRRPHIARPPVAPRHYGLLVFLLFWGASMLGGALFVLLAVISG